MIPTHYAPPNLYSEAVQAATEIAAGTHPLSFASSPAFGAAMGCALVLIGAAILVFALISLRRRAHERVQS